MTTLDVESQVVAMPQRPVDGWTWVAHFSDGSTIAETDDRPFADVVLDGRVVSIVECKPLQDGLPYFSVVLEDGQRPVFFRQRVMPCATVPFWETYTCLGREATDDQGVFGEYVVWNDQGDHVATNDVSFALQG